MHYGPRRWLNQQFGKSNSLSSRLVNLFHITHTWMILKQTCSWSLRRQTFAICIPLSPVITFSEKKSKAIFKSNDTQSYISNSLYLITPLIHFWLCIVGLILYFRGKLLRQLESRDLNMSQNKSSYHALCTYSKICEMTNDVTNVRSFSPDLGPLGPSLSWWRRCTGKKGEQII